MNISTLMYLVVCIVSVVCAFLSTIITFVKNKRNKTQSEVKSSNDCDTVDKTDTNSTESNTKSFEEILNENLLVYMEQAENLFKNIPKSGTTLKLPWVIDKITMDCLREGISFSTDDVKKKVEELTEFSKTVNKI